jgi:O-antigen ligase
MARARQLRIPDAVSVVPLPPSAVVMAAFLVAHLPLALVMRQVPAVAALHAYGTIFFGLKSAYDGHLTRVAGVSVYIMGADVLWRMTNPGLFWELGKYSTVAIFGLALVRRWWFTAPWPAALYFLALLPSCVLTFNMLHFPQARNLISFNLSGPLALAAAAAFFSHMHLSAEKRRTLFLVVLAPALGIAALALHGMLTSQHIEFHTESNTALSGGFGPNQVSSVLGLGALFAFWRLIDGGLSSGMRALLIAALGFMAVHSVLTFSRGGIYGAVIGIAAGSIFLLGDWRALRRVAVIFVAAIVVGNYVVFPRLNDFTNGTLAARYQETELTNRGEISKSELGTWAQNPLLGVGPGVSPLIRAYRVTTHTEFTRLLAEHGSFGAFALLCLITGGIWNVVRAPDQKTRAIVISLLAWSAMYMSNAAMRITAPSLLIGLTFAKFQTSAAPVPQRPRRGPAWRRASSQLRRPRPAFSGSRV